MRSDVAAVLAWLEVTAITPNQYIKYFGRRSLAQRIYDLRQLGYSINKTMVTGVNRFGKRAHWASYSLEG